MEALFVVMIPISGILGGVFLAWSGLQAKHKRREMIHSERMRALELGLELPDFPHEDPVGDAYGNFKAAIILLLIGVSFFISSNVEGGEREMVVPALLSGSLGLAFFLIHVIVPKPTKREPRSNSTMPPLPDRAS